MIIKFDFSIKRKKIELHLLKQSMFQKKYNNLHSIQHEFIPLVHSNNETTV